MIVMSTESGKVLADLPIGAGVDATSVAQGEAFASSGDGTLAVIRKTSGGKYELVQSVKTQQGAKTMGIDSVSHKIFLPTADFDQPKPGARPAAIPGSFKILVVSR
jgi:hypothetical protein